MPHDPGMASAASDTLAWLTSGGVGAVLLVVAIRVAFWLLRTTLKLIALGLFVLMALVTAAAVFVTWQIAQHPDTARTLMRGDVVEWLRAVRTVR